MIGLDGLIRGIQLWIFCAAIFLGVHAEIVEPSSELAAHYRIAFGSCSNPRRGGEIWSLLKSFHPRQLLLLGDQIYADREVNWMRKSPSPAGIAEDYRLLAQQPQWRSLLASLDSWMAIFDDHDYGTNNGDKNFVFRNESIALFRSFYPHTPLTLSLPGTKEEEPQEGVFSAQTFSIHTRSNRTLTYKVVLLDVRSNKDPASQDFLGSQQWRWLEAELSPEALRGVDLIFLASPIQVMTDDKLMEEGWKDFPEQRQRLLSIAARLSLHRHVFILSGDIHSAEISEMRCSVGKKGVRLVELTSSGLSHSFLHQEHPQGERATPAGMPVRSHGTIFEWISGLYQVAHPARYRPHRFADSYRYIHFALLDLDLDVNGQDQLTFRVISHRGDEVLMRPYSLQLPRVGMLEEDSMDESSFVKCEPINGPVPLWRLLLAKAVMIIFLVSTLLLPLIGCLYLVCTSIYYIFIGRELKRRDLIEQQYLDHARNSQRHDQEAASHGPPLVSATSGLHRRR
eukprot:gene1978-2158_t